jgi:hypothetical protein
MTQTRDETGTLTQPVARFVALGLFLMAFHDPLGIMVDLRFATGDRRHAPGDLRYIRCCFRDQQCPVDQIGLSIACSQRRRGETTWTRFADRVRRHLRN